MSSILPNDAIIILDRHMGKNEIVMVHPDLRRQILGFDIENKTGQPIALEITRSFEPIGVIRRVSIQSVTTK